MPTLYVENIPKDLYQALRKRARDHHKSIAAEIITLLESNIPTAETLRRRREIYQRLADLRTGAAAPARAKSSGVLTTEEMIRQDRSR